jgi:hypothetical protein
MAENTEWFIDSGLVNGRAVLKVASVMGELTSMTDDEWPEVVRAAVGGAGAGSQSSRPSRTPPRSAS